MKYLDEYRNADAAKQLAAAIARVTTRPWNIMEVCGGQTHAILRFGLDEMLPRGDHLDPRSRLPGLRHADGDDRSGLGHRRAAGRDLLLLRRHAARAGLGEGPLHGEVGRGRRADRLLAHGRRRLAQKNPGKQVVFFAVGFETTAPANAMAVVQAARLGLANFSVLVSHVLVPPAMCAVLAFALQPRARLPGRRPRLHDHGHARNTSRSPRSTTSRSWSRASSRWTSSKAC